MKSKSASNWSAAQSEEHYGFKRWGAGHFSVDSGGCVQVQPLTDGRTIRIMDVVNEATSMGLKAPFVKDQKVPATLVFEKAGRIDIEFQVDALGATQPSHRP